MPTQWVLIPVGSAMRNSGSSSVGKWRKVLKCAQDVSLDVVGPNGSRISSRIPAAQTGGVKGNPKGVKLCTLPSFFCRAHTLEGLPGSDPTGSCVNFRQHRTEISRTPPRKRSRRTYWAPLPRMFLHGRWASPGFDAEAMRRSPGLCALGNPPDSSLCGFVEKSPMTPQIGT